MLRRCCFMLVILCLLGDVLPVAAQDTSITTSKKGGYLIVGHIHVTGNKKTRTSIILRELNVVPGDTIYLNNLAETLEENRKQLLNTSLFLNVTANVVNWEGEEADLTFDVWERWYTIAVPILKLADRNFNQWWVEKKHSLSRVNIGVKGTQSNLTGRNDNLYGAIQFGYTQKLAFQYSVPYIDKRYRHGLGILFSYSRNREVNDSTSFNKQLFFRQDNFVRQVYNVGLTYSYRPGINTRHQVTLTYNYEKVADSVALINPNYLGNGRTRAQFLDLVYHVTYTKADSWQYPLRGIHLLGEIGKRGFAGLNDISDVRIRLNAAKYWQLYSKTYFALGLRSQFKFGAEQPYINRQAMGYSDDYLRGLEYYVIDGTCFGIIKSTLRQEVLSTRFRLPVVPKKFSAVPLRIFVKIYGDTGYTYSKFPGNGDLNNRMLYTGGAGLDIVSFYDTCLRIEYSVNQLGQKGLFLHTSIDM
ncbi:surface antigen-like variable number repeat protein [Chitinophaga dinghuensis]|uniref:Surface antigen-like variable number repeat protein n=1 Tax=Chitinophaga dinghuensis TaxID=1539050 RepID=A0A327W5T0_9BACT|nr:POTRA domain-containing protein [Chitinophaga dinghuensis]RAJ85765.1 surface antigen-like variable number repeat protein [Chitinophaga dinghuensis]